MEIQVLFLVVLLDLLIVCFNVRFIRRGKAMTTDSERAEDIQQWIFLEVIGRDQDTGDLLISLMAPIRIRIKESLATVRAEEREEDAQHVDTPIIIWDRDPSDRDLEVLDLVIKQIAKAIRRRS